MTQGQISPLILVVEDDPGARERVLNALHHDGFRSRIAVNRRQILAEIAEGQCAAVVLDLGLPNDDGIDIARAIRTQSQLPIIMVTGRGGVRDRIIGFDAGADDYLIKPFAPEELIARIRAILRRAPDERKLLSRHIEVSARIGDALLTIGTRDLSGPLGSQHLTEIEMRLLLALCRNNGVVAREVIYPEIFQRDWDPQNRTLDVHVSHLRGKLESVSGADVTVVAVRGGGYELNKPGKIELADTP
jgi:DNA-binding response OmpR family regulator